MRREARKEGPQACGRTTGLRTSNASARIISIAGGKSSPKWDLAEQTANRVREIAALSAAAVEAAERADWGSALARVRGIRYLAEEAGEYVATYRRIRGVQQP